MGVTSKLLKLGLTTAEEKAFYKKYKAQHKDLRSKGDKKTLDTTTKSIQKEGFHSSSLNTLPLDKGGKATTSVQKGYGNKKGDRVYILSKDASSSGASKQGTKIGHKPTDAEVVDIEYDGQSTYEAYANKQAKLKKKGAALFGVGGVIALSDSEEAQAQGGPPVDQNDTELTSKVTQLVDQGTDINVIREALGQKFDPDKVNSLLHSAYQPKADELRKQGVPEETITEAFMAQGINAPEVSGLPVDSASVPPSEPVSLAPGEQPPTQGLEQLPVDPTNEPNEVQKIAGTEGIAGFGQKVGLSADAPEAILRDGRKISDVISQIKNVDFSYGKMKDELIGATGLSPATRVEATQARKDTNALIQSELETAGVKVESMTPYGSAMVRDSKTGELVEYDEGMMDAMVASSYEIGGAVMGARAGFLAAPPHPLLKGAGTVLGGALGAAFGRSSDVYRNAMDLNYQVSTTEMVDKMNDAAIADVTFGALGLSVSALLNNPATRAMGRGLNRAYDLFIVGNKGGAQKTLKDVFDLNDAAAIELVEKWEKITGNQVLSDEARVTGVLTAKDADASMRAITVSLPGAENVVGRASEEARTGGVKLAVEIDKRAKDLQASVKELTNDNIDVVIQDKLGGYVTETKNFFEDTKNIGTELMKDSPYQFVFKDTALEPAMRASAKGIHNSALRKDFYHYLDRISELGNVGTKKIETVKTIPNIKPAQRKATLELKQAKRADLEKARETRAIELAKGRALKTAKGRSNAKLKAQEKFKTARLKIEDNHLAKTEKLDLGFKPKVSQKVNEEVTTSGGTNSLRSFENLLELRKTINELRSDTRFKAHTNVEQLKASLAGVDAEIEKAALEHMPEGKTWLKQWRTANTEYSNMKNLEQNTLFKTLSKPNLNYDKAVKAITESMSYTGPEVFMQVLGKLPPKSRKGVEGAVLKHLINKHTIGDDAGKQAVSFHRLTADLDKVAFTQPEARALKRTISEFAEVFKNDAQLLAVVGNVPLPKFQSYLTADPLIRLKFEMASTFFNAVKSRIPYTTNAGRAALVKNLGKLLDNPLNARTTKEVLDALPDDPQLKTALHNLAIEFTKRGKPDAYGKVPIYRVHKPGEFNKTAKTKLGKGMLYYTDKTTAESVAKQTGSKVREVMQLHKRIATPEDASRLLGREVTDEELKSPEVLLRLQDQDWAGIAVGDKVLLFK